MKPASKLNKLVYFAGLWILTMALFACAVFAQNTGAGTINGTVTDPAGRRRAGRGGGGAKHQHGNRAGLGDERSGNLCCALYAAGDL